jgi:pyridoxine 5-phosphate synthase
LSPKQNGLSVEKIMTQLSVNVNKIATLRNARGGDVPSVLQVSKSLIKFGAFGITVHPRPDERHIRKQDVFNLAAEIAALKTQIPNLEFNIEGYPSADFLQLIENTLPDQCTLVPDPPDVLTSNAGWRLTAEQVATLQPTLQKLKGLNVRSSVFVDPYDVNQEFLNQLSELRPDRTELYTEMYAKAYGTSEQERVTAVYKHSAAQILKLGIGLNAGHDLNQQNLGELIKQIPEIKEVSIGHAFVAEALYDGLQKTTANYLKILSTRP